MDILLIIFLVGVLAIAAVHDLRFQKIPNLLTYSSMGIALVYHGVMNGVGGVLFSAGGLALGIGLFAIPYLMGGMGAGDAKLMGTVGAIVGAKGAFISFLFTAIIGGAYALILLLMSRHYLRGLIARSIVTLKTFVFTKQLIAIPAPKEERKPRLCYGVAISLGTISYIVMQLSGHNFLV